ncbi:hypothetical protein WJX81_006919 [Elliptochloris bilobata]|uniref:Uncharacterized protein n=1 Tax=Elliptochloris bilobata TaxID=381761 RepID=A0AAW1SLZ2_9CHLO
MQDISDRWWPSFQALYDALMESLSRSDGSPSQENLAECEPLLLRGLAIFQAPSAESRKLFSEQAALAKGKQKLQVHSQHRAAALEASHLLGLDEVQAYVLLRRWLARNPGEVAGVALLPAQRAALAAEYAMERLCLLKCLEGLLLHRYATADGDTEEAGGGALGALAARLLAADLEGALVAQLMANVGADAPADAAPGPQASTALVAAALPSPAVSGGALIPPGAGRAGAAARERAVAECCALLDALVALYAAAGRGCEAGRWVELASALRKGALAGGGGSGAGRRRAELLAALLLLQGLDLDAALAAAAAGSDQASHRLGSPEARRAVDEELLRWGREPLAAAQAPVALAWAAFAALAGAGGGEAERRQYEEHARRAAEAGALGGLAALAAHPGVVGGGPLGGLYRGVLLGALGAAVGAFGLSPASLPAAEADALLAAVCSLFEGQPELCEEFWAPGASGAHAALHHLLDEARGLFPAAPAPLLRLLGALASGRPAAAAASAYLGHLPAVACLHAQGDSRVARVGGRNEEAGQRVSAALPIELAGAVVLPEGVEGEVAPVPACVRTTTLRGAKSGAVLVRWRVASPAGAGHFLLLARLAHQLGVLRQAVAGIPGAPEGISSDTAAAAGEVADAVHLLARLAAAEPAIALQLAQADLVALVAAAAAVLPRLPQPPIDALGDCLDLAAALAASLPARLLSDLAAVPLLQPADPLAAAMDLYSRPNKGSLQDSRAALAFGSQDLPALAALTERCEAPAGRYPVTEGFLRLAAALLEAGVTDAAVQAHAAVVLTRVLPGHAHWRYAAGGVRWRVAAGALRVLRLALLAAAAPAVARPGAPDLATAVARALEQEGAADAALLPALPPLAAELEALAARGSSAEAAAAEALAGEWFALLPVLAARASGPCLAAALLQAPSAGRQPAAAVVASLAGSSWLDPGMRAGALRALAALAALGAELPREPLAACLPQGAGGALAPSVRAAMVEPWRPAAAAANPERFAAAAALLCAALAAHPSLVDALLYPAALAPPPDGADEAKALELAAPGAGVSTKPEKQRGARTPRAPPTWSALDGLWAALGDAPRLRAERPATLAAALHALLALFQASEVAWRPAELLRRQPGFWAALAAVLPDPGSAPSPSSPGVIPASALPGVFGTAGALEDSRGGQRHAAGVDPTKALHDSLDEAWRLAAEAYALQALALEAFAGAPAPANLASQQPRSVSWAPHTGGGGVGSGGGTDGGNAGGVWQVFEDWAKGSAGGRLPALLRRYIGDSDGNAGVSLGGSDGAALLQRLRADADAAAAELLSQALLEEALGPSLGRPGALLGELAARAAPLLGGFPSQAAAVKELSAFARHRSKAPSETLQPPPPPQLGPLGAELRRLHLGELLLSAAESPWGPDHASPGGSGAVVPGALRCGEAYVYDAGALAARLGRPLAAQLPAVRRLGDSMRAVSVAVSLADARLLALRSLRAAAATAARGPLSAQPKPAAAAAAAVDAAAALGAVLAPLLADAAAGEDPGAGTAIGWLRARLALAAEVAEVLLLALQRCPCAPLASAPLRTQPPQPGRPPTGARPSSNPSPAMDPGADMRLCADLLDLVRRWLGARWALGGVGMEAGLLEGFTGALLAGALLALQRVPPPDAAGGRPEELAALQDALERALAPLAGLCRERAAHASAALALVTLVLRRHLPASQWLPVMQQGALNVVELLDVTFERLVAAKAPTQAKPGAAEAEANALLGGALALATTMAQSAGGARLLVDQGVLTRLLALGRWLLGANGGGLGGLAEDSAPPSQGGAGAPAPPSGVDYGGAYLPGSGAPAPAHQQWLALAALAGLLQRGAAGWPEMCGALTALAVAGQARLLSALTPPAGTAAQPLTLAMLQEAERAAFLLGGLAASLGEWALALPGGLVAARRAAAAFVEFAALPSAAAAVACACAPVSPAEKALAAQPPALQLSAGWFGAAAEGSGRSSDFSALLAEAVYACAAQALSFLCAVAPEVADEEAGALGPEWPAALALAGLQQHSSASPDDATAAAAAARGAALARSLLAVAHAAAHLAAAAGVAPAAGGTAEAAEAVRWLAQAAVRGTPV